MKQAGFCQLHVQYSISILHETELTGLHRTLLSLFTEIQKSVQNSYVPSWLHVHSIYAELSGINMLANDDIIVTIKFYPSNKRVTKHKGVLVTLYSSGSRYQRGLLLNEFVTLYSITCSHMHV